MSYNLPVEVVGHLWQNALQHLTVFAASCKKSTPNTTHLCDSYLFIYSLNIAQTEKNVHKQDMNKPKRLAVSLQNTKINIEVKLPSN